MQQQFIDNGTMNRTHIPYRKIIILQLSHTHTHKSFKSIINEQEQRAAHAKHRNSKHFIFHRNLSGTICADKFICYIYCIHVFMSLCGCYYLYEIYWQISFDWHIILCTITGNSSLYYCVHYSISFWLMHASRHIRHIHTHILCTHMHVYHRTRSIWHKHFHTHARSHPYIHILIYMFRYTLYVSPHRRNINFHTSQIKCKLWRV